MAQLSEGLGFDLADALTGYGEALAHFLESMLTAVIETKTHADDSFLARGERLEHGGHLFLQVDINGGLGWGHYALVFNQVAEMSFVITNGRLERQGLLGNFFGLAHDIDRNVHALGNFFLGGLATELLDELLTGANLLVDPLDHVNGDADGACLIGDGARDGLANPPGRVSGKF